MQAPENAKDWFRIENSIDEEDTTDIYVYESIGGWFGMWADDFIRELKQVATSKINLRLNSPGGSVFDGIAIANSIRSHPATVTVYVDSLAASIASVIALAGDRVVMMPQSQFMVHNASGAVYGDATEMTKMADLLDKQSRNIAEAYAQHTGGSLADWQAYMDAETWFTAEEAVAVGLADEVMPMKPAKEEAPAASASPHVMNRTWDLSMYRYAGRDNAPAPQKQGTTRVELNLANGTEQVTDLLREAVRPVTNEATDTTSATSSESIANMTRDDLVALIREVVTTAMAPIEEGSEPPAPPAPSTPESPAPENPAPETPAPETPAPENPAPPEPELKGTTPAEPAEEPDPEDADKKLPPFLQPDEDEEEEEDEPTDEWAGLVARLTAPSPSADDVFTSLKEAW
jgi:ATP-dependent Clp endopeptidase proteolytic subunit ClpP